MKVLMVLTSHDKLGNTGRKTGFWLEELAAPYYVFKDAGFQITLASAQGRSAAARSQRVTSRTSRPTSRGGSKKTPTQTLSWTGRCASITSSRKITIPSSTPVATGRCGISLKTCTR